MSYLLTLAILHPAAQIGWTRFTVHWSTVVGLLALGALYEWRARRRPAGTEPPSAGRRALFAAGLVAIFLALNGWLHDLSDYYLFTAHMVQHLVLTFLAVPFLIMGTPGWMLRPLLEVRGLGPALRWLTHPMRCFAIFSVTVAAWHLPVLYNQAMAIHEVHIAQHLMFMAAATLMWWPVLSPLKELPRLSYPLQMLYLFLLSIPMSIVAVYIVYAREILYPAYASAPRLLGLSPMQDQLLGGLIMWIPGGLFFLGIISVIFFRWQGTMDDSMAGAQMPG
jgi:putative membrane protein